MSSLVQHVYVVAPAAAMRAFFRRAHRAIDTPPMRDDECLIVIGQVTEDESSRIITIDGEFGTLSVPRERVVFIHTPTPEGTK